MFEVWIVQLAFPFWATVFGYGMASRARKSWKKLVGFIVALLGVYGFLVYFTTFVTGAPGLPFIQEIATLFVSRYGVIPAILLIGVLFVNFLAWFCNFPSFKSNARKLHFALISFNAFVLINAFYPPWSWSALFAAIVGVIGTQVIDDLDDYALHL